ncbi:Kinetochore protein spc25 [Zea mays]|uniref:Kinetochore protein SPC25 n=1 Tax=Zea mays TaxID=4577 RepID=A0A3L6FAI1_MAIZE|nr:Kinetochore protein spc25 [Zea mays]
MSTAVHAAAMAEDAAADLRRRMKDKRAAIERRITDSRDRAAAASSAFSAALLEARSIANQTVSNRGISNSWPPTSTTRLFFSPFGFGFALLSNLWFTKLSEQKQHLRKLESDLAQALSVQASRRSKHKFMTESISNTTATNEHLRHLAMDRRSTRDECMNAISNQLKDIESLEAESDANGDKSLETALMWYDKFLGFQVVGGEGVKFVFNKIDVQNPDKKYSFCINLLEKDTSTLKFLFLSITVVWCVPSVDDAEELVKDLNCSNDLYKFVRAMREMFQAATISGILCYIF